MMESFSIDVYGNIFNSTFVDEHGNPVKRTKHTHPYGYDGFVLWQDKTVKVTGTIYSDRLLEWDFAKHDKLCKKHFNNTSQYWDQRNPEHIQAFLRDWCEKPQLKLGLVMQYCNLATGYPCWRFDYNEN